MRISDWSSDVCSSDLEAHLEVELVELARRAVGAAVLVAKAGRALEVAVEAGDHQKLLEHLRRLRQRVELARVQAARHQVGARDLGAAGAEERRLELLDTLAHYALADPLADLAGQADRQSPRLNYM